MVVPTIVIDIYEHAFYVNDQNRKADYAEKFIEGRLCHAFTVPFDAPHAIIVDLVLDESLFRLANTPERRAELRADIDARLMKLLTNEECIVTGSGTGIGASGNAATISSTIEDYNNTFDMRDFPSQRVDPDRLDDEEDADA